MMDPAQRGWYIQLLCEAWESDPQNRLPDDDRFLERLAGAESTEVDFQSRWNAVKKMFPEKEATCTTHGSNASLKHVKRHRCMAKTQLSHDGKAIPKSQSNPRALLL